MAEFRYNGLSATRKKIVGTLNAKSKREAAAKVNTMAKQHNFTFVSVERKRTYLYKVNKKGGGEIRGEQEAFSKDELELALKRMGFDQVRVQPKLLDFKFKPPFNDVIMFIRLSADLLREKLPFDEILNLLHNDVQNASMKRVIKEIHTELKDGSDAEEVFTHQQNMLGKFPAKMLGVASKSGNMAEIYDNTAKFLERSQEFKKSLRSALIMPTVTLLVLFGAVVFYVGYIFPKTAEMFEKFGAALPPMTATTLDISRFLQNHIILVLVLMIVPPLLLVRFFTTDKGRLIFDRYMIKLPLIGSMAHKMSIEIFCRVFHSMYSGSGENIEVIRTAAEACRNKHMEKRIKEITIPLMIREGRGFVEALDESKVFTENALTRFGTGAESGTLRKVALQIANYYERETTYRLKSIVDWIQVVVSFIIMIVMTGLTVISAETAVMQPKLPGMG